MGFSIKKLFQDASSKVGNTVKAVETTATNAVKSAEKTVSNVVNTVRDTADTFEKGVVEPLVHFPTRDAPSNEPALYKNDGKTTTWGNLDGGQLTVDGIQSSDINQGRIGDCYFLSSMASVAQTHPELIQKAITQNPDGTYTVKFHQPPVIGDIMRATGWGGVGGEGYVERFMQNLGIKPTQTKSVQIDGKLPLDGGSDPYVHNGKELWPSLMEKGYAKMFGGYTAIGSGGEAGSALMALTGAKLDHVGSLKSANSDALWAKLQNATQNKYPMVATTGSTAADPKVVTHHCYSVFGSEEKDGQRYVILRNPWGSYEPGNDGTDDGVFRMTLSDFQKNYNALDIAQVGN